MIFILNDPSIPGYLVKIKVGASTNHSKCYFDRSKEI